MTPLDLKGRRFGKLRVVVRSANAVGGKTRWRCFCDCGGVVVVRGEVLVRGDTSSCGCHRVAQAKENFTTHGLSKTREYATWCRMKERCYNPKCEAYPYYGGRGIKICARWLNSFEKFFADMGTRPSSKHSIERLDFNKNYSPSNCIWALPQQQAENKSDVVKIAHNGITDTIAGWSRRTGFPYKLLRRRLRVSKWSVAKALTQPVRDYSG